MKNQRKQRLLYILFDFIIEITITTSMCLISYSVMKFNSPAARDSGKKNQIFKLMYLQRYQVKSIINENSLQMNEIEALPEYGEEETERCRSKLNSVWTDNEHALRE